MITDGKYLNYSQSISHSHRYAIASKKWKSFIELCHLIHIINITKVTLFIRLPFHDRLYSSSLFRMLGLVDKRLEKKFVKGKPSKNRK